MTAQIPDYISFLDEEYSIGGVSDGPLFSPTDWGVEAKSRFSANWRGYTVGYGIIDDELFITRIYMNSEEGLYPKIGGVTPEDGIYKGLKMKVPYGGKLRLLKDFDRKYYMHIGFQAAAGHNTVLELSFEKGRLFEINDRSEEAQALRAEYDKKYDSSPLTILHESWEDFEKLHMKFD